MKHTEILALILSLVNGQIRRVNPEESTDRILTVEIGEKHNNDVVFENIHRAKWICNPVTKSTCEVDLTDAPIGPYSVYSESSPGRQNPTFYLRKSKLTRSIGLEHICNERTLVTSISPSFGSQSGGQKLTITGCKLPAKKNVGAIFGRSSVEIRLWRANEYVLCDIVEFLSSPTNIVCITPKFEVDGRYRVELIDDGVEIKFVNSNKIYISPQYAPFISDLKTRGRSDRFIGSNDKVTLEGDFLASGLEINICK